MTDEKRAELLMEHYKGTYEHILYHWKLRNRLFVFILILLAALAVDAAKPGSLATAANRYIAKSLSPGSQPTTGQAATPTLDFAAVGSLAWFVLLCLVIQYYQRSIHVDRQFNYIGDLEKKLCKMMGGVYVTREGRAYYSKTGVCEADDKDRRPLYLRAVGPLYVQVFPVLLSVFVFVRILHDNWRLRHVTDGFNLLVGIAIVTYSVFYLIWVNRPKRPTVPDEANDGGQT